MAAAASLQVFRSTTDQEEQIQALEETLVHIDHCKQICQTLNQASLLTSENKSTKDTSEILLLLYEFEARVKLKDPGVENLLEQALRMPNPDPNTFETLAALSVEPPAQNKSVSVRALKVAIRKHMQISQPDYTKCSKLFHSLVQLALSGGLDSSCKEEAWNYFIEAIDVIEKRSQGQYPEIEILWLMTKAWNCGINFYSTGRYDDAEKWCGMSMKLLKFLTTMRDNYQEHMNNIYGEVLAKIEMSKSRNAGVNGLEE